jgi:hypothetical protein
MTCGPSLKYTPYKRLRNPNSHPTLPKPKAAATTLRPSRLTLSLLSVFSWSAEHRSCRGHSLRPSSSKTPPLASPTTRSRPSAVVPCSQTRPGSQAPSHRHSLREILARPSLPKCPTPSRMPPLPTQVRPGRRRSLRRNSDKPPPHSMRETPGQTTSSPQLSVCAQISVVGAAPRTRWWVWVTRWVTRYPRGGGSGGFLDP